MAYNTNVSHLTIFMHFKYFGSRPTALHFFHKTWALHSTWLQQCCHAEQTIGDLSYFVFYWVNFSNLLYKILRFCFSIPVFWAFMEADEHVRQRIRLRLKGSNLNPALSAVFCHLWQNLIRAQSCSCTPALLAPTQAKKTSSWDGSRSKQTYPA